MTDFPEGRAVVYCQDAFGTPTGKTAHGLVRRTRRYEVLSVVDSTHAGSDAGYVLDGKAKGIPIVADLAAALRLAARAGGPATHFVIGLAPDGGRLDPRAREAVKEALAAGLHVDSGLHDFLSEDPEFCRLASRTGVQLRDVRKTPDRSRLHPFSGKIDEVRALRVAVLGTDAAVGKRTTSWYLVDGCREAGVTAEMVGTGQTAWLQGARYSITLDSLINDFVAGEVEHAVWSAWQETQSDVIVIEGQGSLMNPAYPGGLEILAAGRPDVVVMQHAPARKEYDGFPGCPIVPLQKQIAAVELLSSKPVVGVTINHEGLRNDEIDAACTTIKQSTGLPVCDVLVHGPAPIVAVLIRHLREIQSAANGRWRPAVIATSV
jgi:uncharacterized NAD-dependent epimerase/dehydratase family protein